MSISYKEDVNNLFDEIIKEYMNRCASDQIDDLLKFISFEVKYEYLLYIIKNRYTDEILHDTQHILFGHKINNFYNKIKKLELEL